MRSHGTRSHLTWFGAIRSRLFGSNGHFYPRLPSSNPLRFQSLYDLAPMRSKLTAYLPIYHRSRII